MKRILFPIIILLFGVAVAFGLYKARPEVETSPRVTVAPLVRVLTVAPQAVTLDVAAQGNVLPRTQIQLTSRVAGEIRSIAKSFEVGGFFRRGDVLLRLDIRDYELAVSRAKAQVAQAQVQVAQQEAEAELAAQEWAQLGDGEPTALTLREPQLAQARAALAAAEADLAKTELDLERTRVVAPFAGRVRSKSVDLGQYVAPGTPLAIVHAIDYAEIRLPIPHDQLRFLDLPFAFRDGASRPGPEVELRADYAGQQHRWLGTIVRSEGEVDTRSRMLSLVARIEDPYGQPDAAEDSSAAMTTLRPPLAVGLFVEATINGLVQDHVAILPRAALRSENQVLIVDGDSRLRYRDVEVIRTVDGNVLIASGLEAGEMVCISPLDIVVDGMEVRTRNDQQPPSVVANVEGSELTPASEEPQP